MYEKIFTDPALIDFFHKTNQDTQRLRQKRFLTYLTGGSKIWTGIDMKKSHKGRGISWEHHNLIIKHVIQTMSDLGVARELQDEVFDALFSMIDDCTDGPSETDKETLYYRLGGKDSIQAVVDGMYVRIWSDPNLNEFFKKTNKPEQKKRQFRFLLYVTGGTPVWAGRSMVDSHKGRGIMHSHFNLTVQCIVQTMRELGVELKLILEVDDLLYSIRDECTDGEDELDPSTLYARLGGAPAIR